MPQLYDVLFDDLRSSKKSVNRLLSAGLLFALIAHFYVVEPYFEYRKEEPSLKIKLDEKKKQYDQLLEQSERITNLSQNIRTNQTDFEKRIKEFPQHLRGILSDLGNVFPPETSSNTSKQSTHTQQSASIQQSMNIQKPVKEKEIHENYPNIQSSAQQSMQSQEPEFIKIGNFTLPSDVTTLNDGIHWYIETWFSNLLDEIGNEIVEPVRQAQITSDMVGYIDLQNVTKQGIEDIKKYIDNVEKQNPNFWQSYSGPRGKVDVAYELQNEVKKSFGLLEEKIHILVERLRETVKVQKEELDKMDNDMTKLQESKEELDSRLSSLESPFGRIPADLPDLIKLFPILMVALLVTITITLRKCNNLYTALWDEFKKDNKESDYRVFQRHADCWYLPLYVSIFQPLLLGVLIAIIAGIFVRACFLVISAPSLFISLTGESEIIRKNLFAGAYLVGSLVIIGCLWFIGKIFMRRF
ncbi:MAG: hypothetical protein U0586_16805 [Candidatus Brocadiaceae bacterium]